MSIKKIKYGITDAEMDYGPLSFAKILAAHRLGEEISQKDFAFFLGISQQSLCDLEKGRKVPSPERAAKIAEKLGEPTEFWIQTALQDMLRAQHFNYVVSLSEPVKRKKVS